MAATVSSVYLCSVPLQRKREGGLQPFRLPPTHVQTLRDIARGVEESEVGICCSYLVDASSGEGADFDEHALHDIERFVEGSITWEQTDPFSSIDIIRSAVVKGWRNRMQRARRAVDRLRRNGDHDAASILFVAYGYPDPLGRDLLATDFGEKPQDCPLASLARYTHVVEEHRLRMARAEAVERMKANPPLVTLYELTEHRRVYERAERCTSSGDALRDLSRVFAEAGPTPTAGENQLQYETRRIEWRERQERHKAEREGFLGRMKLEATRMLARAERAWYGAWLADRSGEE